MSNILRNGIIALGRLAARRRKLVDCFHCGAVPSVGLVALRINWPGNEAIPYGLTPSSVHGLCVNCAEFLKDPGKLKSLLLKPGSEDCFQISYLTLGSARVAYLDPVGIPEPAVRPPTMFKGKAVEMARFCSDHNVQRQYCENVEALGLRAVGCFSSAEDIAAVYQFGLIFGQDAESSEGPPYWSLDPRLNGIHRIAYLIKNSEGTAYVGAVAFDTRGYNTLTWAWINPSHRGRGILTALWPRLEDMHPSFKILAPLSTDMRKFLKRNHDTHELTELTGGL